MWSDAFVQGDAFSQAEEEDWLVEVLLEFF